MFLLAIATQSPSIVSTENNSNCIVNTQVSSLSFQTN